VNYPPFHINLSFWVELVGATHISRFSLKPVQNGTDKKIVLSIPNKELNTQISELPFYLKQEKQRCYLDNRYTVASATFDLCL
jgi:hypothetical protein